MNHNARFNDLLASLIAIGLMASYASSGYAEPAPSQSEQRQAARDTRQIGRQEARQDKQACKDGDEKSRSECRQDKRDAKMDARGAAKDIKRN